MQRLAYSFEIQFALLRHGLLNYVVATGVKEVIPVPVCKVAPEMAEQITRPSCSAARFKVCEVSHLYFDRALAC